jgi:intein/homing endonuclease
VNGEVIRTTVEHPFYVRGKGWVAAGALQLGDRLASHNGKPVTVDDLLETGECDTVYNLRIADFYTYFVAGANCERSVWAHNACVYQSVEDGIARYAGIADTRAGSTLAQRLAIARARTPAALSAVIPATIGVTTLQAQQMEQALIHYHGRQGADAGGSLVNVNLGVNVFPANTSNGYKLLSVIDYWGGRQFSVHADGSGI